MTRPYDVEDDLRKVAQARVDADELTAAIAEMGDAMADGFRARFDLNMDMEHSGLALMIAAAMLSPIANRGDTSPSVLSDALAMAAENLVRHARARTQEVGEEALADLEARFKESLGKPLTLLLSSEPVCREFVLTWHPFNGAPPVEVPLDEHWVFPAESCGEFRLSTREVEVSGG